MYEWHTVETGSHCWDWFDCGSTQVQCEPVDLVTEDLCVTLPILILVGLKDLFVNTLYMLAHTNYNQGQKYWTSDFPQIFCFPAPSFSMLINTKLVTDITV